MIQKLRKEQQFGTWMDGAGDATRWSNVMPQLVTFYTQTCTKLKRFEARCCGESVAMFCPFQLRLTPVLDCPNSRFVAHERPYVPTSTRRFLHVVTHQKRSTSNRCQCLSFFHHTNRIVSSCCTSLPALLAVSMPHCVFSRCRPWT